MAKSKHSFYPTKTKWNFCVLAAWLLQTLLYESTTNRAFGQLSLIQYLHRELGLSSALVLPKVLNSYPHNDLVPFERTGAPVDWKELELWKPI